jgi:hypothetical protein
VVSSSCGEIDEMLGILGGRGIGRRLEESVQPSPEGFIGNCFGIRKKSRKLVGNHG